MLYLCKLPSRLVVHFILTTQVEVTPIGSYQIFQDPIGSHRNLTESRSTEIFGRILSDSLVIPTLSDGRIRLKISVDRDSVIFRWDSVGFKRFFLSDPTIRLFVLGRLTLLNIRARVIDLYRWRLIRSFFLHEQTNLFSVPV